MMGQALSLTRVLDDKAAFYFYRTQPVILFYIKTEHGTSETHGSCLDLILNIALSVIGQIL